MGLTASDREQRQYVVYFLRCPLTGLVRYIGLTSNPTERQSNHSVRSDGYAKKRDWIEWLRWAGLKHLFEIKTPEMSYASACHVELRLIAMFQLHFPGQLYNGHVVKDGLLRKVSGWRALQSEATA